MYEKEERGTKDIQEDIRDGDKGRRTEKDT